jgi:hypothetical protein
MRLGSLPSGVAKKIKTEELGGNIRVHRNGEMKIVVTGMRTNMRQCAGNACRSHC